MTEVGSVVFGAFAVNNAVLKNHYSIVVGSEIKNGEEILSLVYTSSLKADDIGVKWSFGAEFEPHEAKMAGFKNPCRYDASMISEVPACRVKRIGTVPSRLITRIHQHCVQAHQRNQLKVYAYSTSLEVRYTGSKQVVH